MPLTLYRYLTKEILSAFLLGLAVFTGVLLMGQMLKIADMVVSKGVPLTDTLLLILYLMPKFLPLTVPMSLLFSVLLTFSRLSGDSEITALKASGISLYRLLPPVMLIAIATYIVTTITSLYILPMGNTAFKDLLFKTVYNRISLNLKERVFNTAIPKIVVYINGNDTNNGYLTGVMIQDQRNPESITTIFAERGLLVSDEKNHKISLSLNDGSIHQPRKDDTYRFMQFAQYDLVFDLPGGNTGLNLNETDMPIAEIQRNLRSGKLNKKESTDMRFEVQKRFALPFACLIFAIVAVPLGMQNRRSGKASGFSFSIATLLIFYIFQSFFRTLGEKGILTPVVATWSPNLIFLFVGIYLFRKSAREESVPFFDVISKVASMTIKRAASR